MRLLIYISILLGILVSSQARCQDFIDDSEKKVVVFLKSGSKVIGDVVEWVPGEYIEFVTSWGQTIKLEDDQIEKVVEFDIIDMKLPTPYNFKEKGRYFSIKAQFIAGNAGERAEDSPGMGISVSAGHRYNRYLSLGGGIGYDKYIMESGEDIVPIFAEVGGFTGANNKSFAYNLQVGYGIAGADEDYLLSEARGGIHLYPSIGYRFGKNENIKYVLDVGYKFQKARFSYHDPWNFATRNEQDVLFQRLTLRFGLLL